MKAALSVLEPEMKRRGSERVVQGKVILATVQGDIHEIGKSLVGTMDNNMERGTNPGRSPCVKGRDEECYTLNIRK